MPIKNSNNGLPKELKNIIPKKIINETTQEEKTDCHD